MGIITNDNDKEACIRAECDAKYQPGSCSNKINFTAFAGPGLPPSRAKNRLVGSGWLVIEEEIWKAPPGQADALVEPVTICPACAARATKELRLMRTANPFQNYPVPDWAVTATSKLMAAALREKRKAAAFQMTPLPPTPAVGPSAQWLDDLMARVSDITTLMRTLVENTSAVRGVKVTIAEPPKVTKPTTGPGPVSHIALATGPDRDLIEIMMPESEFVAMFINSVNEGAEEVNRKGLTDEKGLVGWRAWEEFRDRARAKGPAEEHNPKD